MDTLYSGHGRTVFLPGLFRFFAGIVSLSCVWRTSALIPAEGRARVVAGYYARGIAVAQSGFPGPADDQSSDRETCVTSVCLTHLDKVTSTSSKSNRAPKTHEICYIYTGIYKLPISDHKPWYCDHLPSCAGIPSDSPLYNGRAHLRRKE